MSPVEPPWRRCVALPGAIRQGGNDEADSDAHDPGGVRRGGRGRGGAGDRERRRGGDALRLKASASGANKFNKTRLHAEPGKVTIRLRNPSTSGKPHAVEIEGKGVEKKSRVAQPGDRVSVSARLKRGRYEFYCPVDGHKAAGMEGTLIVG